MNGIDLKCKYTDTKQPKRKYSTDLFYVLLPTLLYYTSLIAIIRYIFIHTTAAVPSPNSLSD